MRSARRDCNAARCSSEKRAAARRAGGEAPRLPAAATSVRECACGGEASLVAARPVSRRRRVTRVVSYSSLRTIAALLVAHLLTFRLCRLSRSRAWRSFWPRNLVSVLDDFTSRHNNRVRCSYHRDTVKACCAGAYCDSGGPDGRRSPCQWSRDFFPIGADVQWWMNKTKAQVPARTALSTFFWWSATADRQNWAQTVSRWVSSAEESQRGESVTGWRSVRWIFIACK